MKKIVVLYIMFCFMLLPAIVVRAESQATIAVVVDKQTVKVGDIIKCTIQAENITDVYGVQFKLSYDEAYIYLKNETVKSPFMSTVGKNISTGSLNYVGTKIGSDKGNSGNIDLVTMEFTVRKVGATAITLGNVASADSNGNTINTNIKRSLQINFEEPKVTTPEPQQPTNEPSNEPANENNPTPTQPTNQTANKPDITKPTEQIQTVVSSSEQIDKEANPDDKKQTESENESGPEPQGSIQVKNTTENKLKGLNTINIIIISFIVFIIIIDILMFSIVNKRKKKNRGTVHKFTL